ncbi:MAG: o-succinylbenzoate synthase [Gemmatimonadales bacterium]
MHVPAGAGMKIDRIELREIRLRLVEPFEISSGVEIERRILLLRMFETGGTDIWSECVAGGAPNYFPETIDTAWLMLRDHLAPLLLGCNWQEARDVAPLLGARVRGNNMAKAALEMGCWALEASLRNMPLAALLGGERTSVATGISLGIQGEVAKLVDRAVHAEETGYRKIKIKVAPGRDIDFVREVRERLPEGNLMVDANSAYTLDDVEHLRDFDEFDLIMIEQPLAWDDLADHAVLRRSIATPICLDESIWSVRHAREMIDRGSGNVINIKPGRVGGYREAIAIHDLAQSAAMPVWCGGMLESGIGRAYNVAMASLSNFTIPGDISPSSRYWEHDIVTPEWTMNGDGFVTVPRGAGLGVEVDAALIDDLTVRREIVA